MQEESVIVNGFTHPNFKKVETVFKENFQTRGEQGAAFCVYYKGKRIIDLWGGYANTKEKLLWQEDTLANVYSTTKGITNLVIATLVGKGILNYDEKICRYWPAFKQNGKENITLSQLLSHQAGLTHFEKRLTVDELEKITYGEREEFSSFLAAQKPVWSLNGSNFGYHALTVGFFAAELIRQVDSKHRPFRIYFEEEFSKPLNLQFHLTVPSNIPSSKIARLTQDNESIPSNPDFATQIMDRNSISYKSFNAIQGFTPWKARYTEIPSAIGYSTARALAQFYGAFANKGKIDDFTISSFSNPQLIQETTKVVSKGFDLVRLENTTFTKGGFGIDENFPLIGHSGFGGSGGYCDLDKNLSFGYVTNVLKRESPDSRKTALIETVYESLNNHLTQSKL